MDITHFAIVFNYDVTILKAQETLRRTANNLWSHNKKQQQSVCIAWNVKKKVFNRHFPMDYMKMDYSQHIIIQTQTRQ